MSKKFSILLASYASALMIVFSAETASMPQKAPGATLEKGGRQFTYHEDEALKSFHDMNKTCKVASPGAPIDDPDIKPIVSAIIILGSSVSISAKADMDFDASKRYMVFPISETSPLTHVAIFEGDRELTYFNIKLAADSADYLMPFDISEWAGKTLTLKGNDDLSKFGIILSDSIPGASKLYKERYRPRYHFTTKRGWINDPNGLVYHDGEYHLFYQYNPVGVEWGNMNWGHAVSKDLIHWEELPIALRMGPDGEIYSGSAVMDYDNISGLGKEDKPAMLAFYTLQAVNSREYDRDGQMQCLAYSTDDGRTWEKYSGNPIIDTRMKNGTWHNRDPKVFYHDDSGKWIMVVHEKDGHSIYNSDNLIDWAYQSHVPGFWECPELFMLPVDGANDKNKWVLSGASGTYMIGNFDGKEFIPESGKHYYATGYLYAPQTYNNTPDGRRIQIGWASIRKPGMPFTGEMLLPVELSLTETKDGPRLKANPLPELDKICRPILEAKELSMDEANSLISEKIKSTDGIRIKTKMRMTHPTNAGLFIDGKKVLDYDLNFNKINSTHYFPQEIGDLSLSFDMWIDAMSIETFFDDGLYVEIAERPDAETKNTIKFWSLEPLVIESLEIFEVDSIW